MAGLVTTHAAGARTMSRCAGVIVNLANPAATPARRPETRTLRLSVCVAPIQRHADRRCRPQFPSGGLGAESLNGGPDSTTPNISCATAAVDREPSRIPAINTGEAAGDTYVSIEGLLGSNFNDTLIGDANTNILRGGLGADVLNGGGGFDFAQL